MACLRKRNGTYYAQYYIGSRQKRVSLRTGNYQLAKAALNELEHKLDCGQDSPLRRHIVCGDFNRNRSERTRLEFFVRGILENLTFFRERF